jgi:hypothetical protein
MTSLLGIALVVDDINKGCNLAFRYPAPPTSINHVSTFHQLSAPLIAKLFRPKNALCNQSFELVIDNLCFISHPVLVSKKPSVVNNNVCTSSSNSKGYENETTMFNIIFALENVEEYRRTHDQASRQRCLASYRSVAAQLSNALLHEEMRAGFVSKEVRELLHIRDELVQNERMVAGTTGGGSSSVRKETGTSVESSNCMEVDPQTLIDVSLGKSVLANNLKSVYHGLDEIGTVHVVINRWIKLSLTLTDTIELKLGNLRPYQTLLLLQDEDAIIDALPPDHSEQLKLLIEIANPLKSFQELSVETSIPLQQLFRLSAHLVHWGFGRVIDTITMHNIYQVNSKANIHSQSSFALEFRRKFPPRELCEILSSFSGSRRIGESMKNLSAQKKIEYVHMLIWLLQRHFIVQLHRYVYFMIPPEVEHPAHTSLHRNHLQDENEIAQRYHPQHHQNGLNSPSGFPATSPAKLPSDLGVKDENNLFVGGMGGTFTEQERQYLEKIATNTPVFALFKRLCVYFHGQYHLEEIMWRENVSRSELRTVLSTYQDIIVCCLHE